MNRTDVNRIVNAVLYEGYILYPYRPSLKNRQRWTFGGLYPEAYSRTHIGDASGNQTECLVHGSPATNLSVAVRFLHLTARQVSKIDPPRADCWDAPAQPVEELRVGDQRYQSWQEAEERIVELPDTALRELSSTPRQTPFRFPGGVRTEPIRAAGSEIHGILVREQQPIEGIVEVAAVQVEDDLFRVTVRVENRTPWADERGSRDDALLRSLVSAHTILGVGNGEFVSLLDPPTYWQQAVAECRNIGVWPVLVGSEGETDTMLSSPIILYDYPQIAPESQGDFFDGTEMDEMLSLRVLTLTDEEKQAMAAVDERTRALLARTEALARDQLLQLHGTIRGLRPLPEEDAHG